jgi:cytochrome c553
MNLFRIVVAGLIAAFSFAANAQKADAVKGQTIAGQVCVACHGADGNAAAPVNPKLAGQHADYVYKQLSNFKVKPGAAQAERVNAVMAGFAATLSEQDMRDLAAWFESQKQIPAVGQGDKDSQLRGQKIYRGGIPAQNVPACASCHGPSGAGIPSQYPRIGGQWGEYVEAQMIAFRQGARKNNAAMSSIAYRMSDRDIKAVSDYIAALR